MIKKILMTVLGSGLLTIGMPAMAAHAVVPDPTFSAISGTVTHNGSPVSGASVTVTCDGNVLTDVSDASGGYEVDYTPASLCPATSTAHVTATKGALSGSNTGPVEPVTTDLNIALVDVSVVPELGVITSIGASITAVGAFMVIRRRQAEQM